MVTPFTTPSAITSAAAGKPGVDLDAQGFRLRRQPFAQVGQADDIVAVIVHQLREQEIGNADRTGRPQVIEAVVGHRRVDRRAFRLPVGNELVDADGIDHRARKDMRPDLGTLLQKADGDLRIDLLQPDRRAQPRRPAADDHDVVFHAFALNRLCLGHVSNLFHPRKPLMGRWDSAVNGAYNAA
ncbi:MAG: hypothetical protein WDM81_17470 [Rhizomicrobium sp.]